MRALLIGLLVLAVVILVIMAQPPARRRAWILGAAGLVLVGLLLWLTATGRLHWLAAAFASLLPFARRLLPLLRYVPLLRRFVGQRRAGGAAPGAGQSEVATDWLRMRLDHASGDMDGEILQGELAGRRLSQLDFATLAGLFERLRGEDPESARLLQAYLEREHAQAWEQRRQAAGDAGAEQSAAGGAAISDREEALHVLGLAEDADEAAIIEAHRRLMQRLHPDHGGSDYLAAKVNAARDLLLGERRRAG